MTDLRGRVDKLDIDLFGLPGLDGGEDALSEGDGSLSGAHDAALDEDEVLVDLTVVREAAHGCDVLLDGVSFGRRVVGDTVDSAGTNPVDLVVDLGTGVVTELTTSGDRPLDGARMPRSDTGNLTQTSVCLTVQAADTESLDHTGHALTAGDTDGIDALALLEDLTDLDFLLELAVGPVDLLSDGTTVDLDLHDVSLVLSQGELADLSSADDANNLGVLLHSSEVSGDVRLRLVVLVLAVDVLGEGLLLGLVPVLVESALDIVVHVLGPDGVQGAETTGGWDVADKTNDLHGRAFNDGDRVDDILLDGLLAFTTFLILDDVGHTGLVTHESGQVDGFAGVVAGERSNAATVVTCAPLGQVGEGAAPWVLKLSVGHVF